MKIVGVVIGYTLMVGFMALLFGATTVPATTVLNGTTFTASESLTQVTTTVSNTVYTAASIVGQAQANLPMVLIGLIGMIGGAIFIVVFLRMKA